MPLSDEHLAELSEVKRLLENPGLAVKITNLVGKPIEKGFELLPDSWSQRIGVATKDALMFAMNGARSPWTGDPESPILAGTRL